MKTIRYNYTKSGRIPKRVDKFICKQYLFIYMIYNRNNNNVLINICHHYLAIT